MVYSNNNEVVGKIRYLGMAGIALGYGLDDRGVRVPVRAGNFSLHHRVQNCSWTHPASYPMGTTDSFPKAILAEGVKLTTHLHLVPKKRMHGAIPPLPQYQHGVVLS
jgi:hypothetical protein